VTQFNRLLLAINFAARSGGCAQSPDRIAAQLIASARSIFRNEIEQNGHQIPQDQSRFLQRLFRRPRNRQSGSDACRPQAANSAAAVAVASFDLDQIFHPILVSPLRRHL